LNLLFSFTDPGTLDKHTATMDWGDGTISPGIVDENAHTIAFSHTYGDEAGSPFKAKAAVSDNDGESDSQSFNVTVHAVAPTWNRTWPFIPST